MLVASARASDDLVQELANQPLPFVLVNRRLAGMATSVSAADEAGSRLAVAHLADLGHTRIGHIAGPADADTARRRLAGFMHGLAQRGLEQRPDVVAEGDFTEEGGFHAMTRLLNLTPRPTAVMGSSLAATIGALAAIKRAALRVPEDVSVIGFHDAPVAEYLDPALTTVRMPLREMAERSVECLVRLIHGEIIESEVVPIAPVLVRRASTAPPPQSS